MLYSSAPAQRLPNSDLLMLLGAILLTLSWLIPNYYPPWSSFYLDFSAFLALLLGMITLAACAPSGSVRIPIWICAVLALPAIPLIQAACGLIFFAGDGWIAAAYLAGFGCACLAGFALARVNVQLMAEGLAWVFLVSAVASMAIMLNQWTGISGMGIWAADIGPGDIPYANLRQPNNLATLLSLGLGSTFYLRTRNRFSLAGTFLLVVLLVSGIALTQSRTAWVGGIALLTWWAVKRKAVSAPPAGVVLAVPVLYVAAFFLLRTLNHALLLAPPPGMGSAEVGVRGVIWTQLLDAFIRQPLWGYGWNQVGAAQVSVAEDYTVHLLVTHSHNFLIDLLLWNGGLIGLLLIAGLVAWGLARCLRCRTTESWFGLLCIGFVLTHAMFELPLEYAYFLIPVGLLAGMVDADQGVASPITVPRRAIGFMCALAVVMLTLIWHDYRNVEDDYRLMRFEAKRIGTIRATQAAPDVVLLTQLSEFMRFARMQEFRNLSPAELEWVEKVAHRYPYPSTLFRNALVLALNGHSDRAILELIRIRRLHSEADYADAVSTIKGLSESKYPELGSLALPLP